MKALVVGYGSAGQRHVRVLRDLGCQVAIVSHHEPGAYAELDAALRDESPEYAVIANETIEHRGTLTRLAETGFAGKVLVEKPLFRDAEPLPENQFAAAFVAYNLRFHPLLAKLRAALLGERLLSIRAYAGQYLPDWRPNRAYASSYSASRTKGGGVLRDLSHELDYLGWMAGPWQAVAALGGHLSSLEIESDDCFAVMMQTDCCPVVELQLNYLDRSLRREVLVHTNRTTFRLDLAKHTLEHDSHSEAATLSPDLTYRRQHEAILSGQHDALCSLEDGLASMHLIEAIEQAARHRTWVSRC